MANINRDYIIQYSPKNSKVTGANGIFFYTSDKNTTNIFISIVSISYQSLFSNSFIAAISTSTLDSGSAL